MDRKTTENRTVVYRLVGPPDEEFIPESQNPARELFAKADEFFGCTDTLLLARV